MPRPQPTDAAEYYSTYIGQVQGDDIRAALAAQSSDLASLCAGISEEQSLFRYAADKWSIREVMGHINDCERVFTFRALWFARGFAPALPSFDQNTAIAHAASDARALVHHVSEFQALRSATLSFVDNLPADAWSRTGVASDNTFTVNALLYITAGHAAHHLRLIRERYLTA